MSSVQRRSERDAVTVPLTSAVLAQREIGVAVCDPSGLLLEQNGALRDMLGVGYDALRSEQWPSRYHLYTEDGSRPLEPEETPLARALQGEAVVDAVISVLRPDSAPRYLRCSGTRIHHPDGEIAGAVCFVVDATAPIRLRHELDALRERLIDTVNHELRTPAAALVGHVELLRDLCEELPPPAAWSVEALSRNLARMQAILDRISDMADAVSSRR